MKNLICLYLLLYTLASNAQSSPNPIVYPYYDGQRWGLTNANLDVVAAPQFDTTVYFPYRSSTYAIAIKNKKYGTVDRDGKAQLDFTYDKIRGMHERYGLGTQNGKTFLLNLEAGKVVSPEPVDVVNEFCYCEDKMFIVTRGGKKYLLNGITGKQVGKNGFDDMSFFNRDHGPRAKVKVGSKLGLIDTKTGDYVIPAKYDRLQSVYQNRKEVIEVTTNGETAYLDGSGKPVKDEPAKTSAEMEGMAETVGIEMPAEADDSYNKDLYVYNQGNGSWKVTLENRGYGSTKVFATYELQGYTNLVKLLYKSWDDKFPVLIKAMKDGKTGIIGLKGEVLIPFEYDSIEKMNNSMFITMKNGKVGVIKHNLVVLKKPVLKKVIEYNNYLEALLIEMPNGKRGYMDEKTGKIYIPGVTE